MTSRDFCYWMQSLFEVAELKTLNEKQMETVRCHLAMVFIHEIDPSFPAGQQDALQEAHDGPPPPPPPSPVIPLPLPGTVIPHSPGIGLDPHTTMFKC